MFTDVTGNYNDTSGTVNDKINKADADCSSISGYTRHLRRQRAHRATGTCKGVDGTTALAGLDKSGTTHTNAGTYTTDPWTFTDVTGNYNDTSGTVNDKIDKVQLAVTPITSRRRTTAIRLPASLARSPASSTVRPSPLSAETSCSADRQSPRRTRATT